ncbi:MAG: DUF4491 family protein [Clostridia bacterium]|nr:DUF4491 family protein [Clostridia bacterium]
MHFNGVIIGALAFLSIGVWHPIVIKGEYYLGKKVCIPIFLLIGLACVAGSIFCPNEIVSTGLAVFGFSALWGISEVIHQEKRVAKGWFPKNPRKKK